ncbi:nitroreductase family protein [Helicobacter vulpis]|uniref:hypothetical protein n=1 Tax=Helicobacter vulpis TaxID=2316076 RepID=UPI0013CDE8A9|nr:hypothetical protein [Helicobacter vulpis]
MHMEVGHFAQTLQMVLGAMGLQGWVTGAFIETLIAQGLHLDLQKTLPAFFVAAGRGHKKSMQDLMQQALERC